MLSSEIVFFYDSVYPHIAVLTEIFLDKLRWELFDHPPYNLILAPSNFHLLMHVNNWLGHSLLVTTKSCSQVWLRSQVADFCNDGIQKLLNDMKGVPIYMETLWKNRLKLIL